MAGDLLASRYVQLSMKGQAEVAKGLKQIRDELNRAKAAGQMLGKALKDGTYLAAARDLAELNKRYAAMRSAARVQDLIAEHGQFVGRLKAMQEQMAGVTRAATVGFALITGATLGWVKAGMQGTVEQYQLEYGFQRLSRAIAGAFKPTIDDATNGVHRLANWFQGLNGHQQEGLRRTVLWTAGIMGGVLAVNLLAKALEGAAVAGQRVWGLLSRFGRFAGAAAPLAIGAGMIMDSWDKIDKDINDAFDQKGRYSPEAKAEMRANRDLITAAGLGNRKAQEELRRKGFEQNTSGVWSKVGPSEAEQKRKDLTLNQTGFQEVGASYDLIANAVMKIDTPMDTLRASIDALNETMKTLQESGVINRDIKLPPWLGGRGG